MGDYLKNGAKIGTCGSAYYATKKMLEKAASDPEAAYYLNPENSCSFAFPFPEYDGKKAGEITNFHEGERVDFFFSAPEGMQIFHSYIWFHTHPKGGEGVNIQTPCVYQNEATTSKMYYSTARMRLDTQKYYKGSLYITAKCIYCGESTIFDREEAFLIAEKIDQAAVAIGRL